MSERERDERRTVIGNPGKGLFPGGSDPSDYVDEEDPVGAYNEERYATTPARDEELERLDVRSFASFLRKSAWPCRCGFDAEEAAKEPCACTGHGHENAATFIEHLGSEVARLRRENEELRTKLDSAEKYGESWRKKAESLRASKVHRLLKERSTASDD